MLVNQPSFSINARRLTDEGASDRGLGDRCRGSNTEGMSHVPVCGSQNGPANDKLKA